jgi:hypothetical protein
MAANSGVDTLTSAAAAATTSQCAARPCPPCATCSRQLDAANVVPERAVSSVEITMAWNCSIVTGT